MKKRIAAEQPVNLLCLSHLNWDHVWQRPQQLMTRLTERYRVCYVDPPQVSDSVPEPQLVEYGTHSGVEVLRPHFPLSMANDPVGYWSTWHNLLPELLARVGPNTVLWVFSPYADTLVARALPHIRLSVYDCMDDLASFRGGSPELRIREEWLLAQVDLVFTGGYSMYLARKDRHPRVHCFPSGVDIVHYQQNARPAINGGACTRASSSLLAGIPRPRLGYFGVLDERIDWELIATVAARQPHWHWVLIGPTAKVDPAELPKAANIHYLGKKPYAELPAYLRGFDIATMPFALNEATRYISPTKTLEYLAGGKWVLSSSVPDVVAFYEDIVSIADGADAWITAAEALLHSSPTKLQAQLARTEPILAANTWESIAGRMADLIDTQLDAQVGAEVRRSIATPREAHR
jgi:glycosyltransferase involved in cell wall biosynthesis